MIYKKLSKSDVAKFKDEIISILVDIYIENFKLTIEQSYNISNEKFCKLEQYINDGSAIILACIMDDNLVGFLWIYIYEYFNEKRLHINQIGVCKQYRGKGVGRNLLDMAENVGHNLGVNIIDLFVLENNTVAKRLYSMRGFTVEKSLMEKNI